MSGAEYKLEARMQGSWTWLDVANTLSSSSIPPDQDRPRYATYVHYLNFIMFMQHDIQ